jgi:hypothetical protein
MAIATGNDDSPLPGGPGMPLLERLGLHRRELRSWAMYEWAITGMWAVIVAAIFPTYYREVVAADLPGPVALQYWGYATMLGIALVAVVAPLMGPSPTGPRSRSRSWQPSPASASRGAGCSSSSVAAT